MSKAKAQPKKRKPAVKSKAIVISQIALTEPQRALIKQVTPPQFIKERPARGGKKARYVEGGYVIAQLNNIFGAPNWDFEILEQSIEKELDTVWVRGKLTVIDHKNGWRVGKTQYGQHDIAANVPLGDSLKAASTDCLKKCASLFGIALDVYWQQIELEEGGKSTTPVKPKQISEVDLFKNAVAWVEKCNDVTQLLQSVEKLKDSKLSEEHRKKLSNLISRRVDEIDNPPQN